jgi:hypothetical protein
VQATGDAIAINHQSLLARRLIIAIAKAPYARCNCLQHGASNDRKRFVPGCVVSGMIGLQDTAMKYLIAWCTAISLAAINLTGCAATHVQTTQADTAALGTESCFWVRYIRHWDVIDPSTMIVYAPLPQNAFLVKLLQPIPDLNFHFGLGFEDADRTGRICRVDGYVSVGEPFPMRVAIAAVRALTPEQVRQLKASGKARDNGKTPTGSAPAAPTTTVPAERARG